MNNHEPPTQPPAERIEISATGYFFCGPPPATDSPPPLLLGIHGYGQTGPEFLKVIQKIAGPDCLAIAGQGFNQLWNPKTQAITFNWMTAFEKADSIARNNEYLGKMLDRLAEQNRIDPARVFLLGFSQGSSVAFRFAQANPGRVAGIISVCADLPPDVEKNLEPLKSTAALIVHSENDPYIPTEMPAHAHRALTQAGMASEIISFDRGHLVPSRLAPQIQAWMRQTENI